MRKDPVPPDSERIKRALLPARIAWWRKCGQEEMAQQLERELAAVQQK
jgi:hypothetical protein